MSHDFQPKLRTYFILMSLPFFISCSQNEFHGSVRRMPTYSGDVTVSAVDTKEASVPVSLEPKAEMLMGSFPAARTEIESLRFTLDTREVSTDFELKDILQDQTQVFRQMTRPRHTERFQQGHPPSAQHETFDQQSRRGMVDILLVIDDSISMKEEQRNLSDKMHELVGAIEGSDWQIGVITTSAVYENNVPQCVMNLIRSTEADADEKFKKAVLAGTSGDRNEQGILQAVVGLSCPTHPWLRPGASVAVLIVSDEDNCSADGLDCPGTASAKETFLIDYVEKDLGRVIGKNAGFYGIFSPPASPCQTSSNVGLQYQRLVDYKAQGALNYGNICDVSYKSTLNRISDSIATLLSSQFELKDLPLPSSLQLKMQLSDGTERWLGPGDYSIDQRTISFSPGKEPPVGAQLRADYTVAGLPMWKEVELGDAAALDTIEVMFDDDTIASDDYRLEGRTLKFAEMPPAETLIRVQYRSDLPLPKTFNLPVQAQAGSVQAKIDGQETRSFQLDPLQRALTFQSAPSDGAEIELHWTYRQGPQLSYALPLGEESSGYQIIDEKGPIPFTVQQGVFTLPLAEHKLGKILTLRYQMPDFNQRVFALAHEPLPESAQLDQGPITCRIGGGVVIKGSTLTSTCGVTSRTEFTLSYLYYVMQTDFSLSGVIEPERGQWRVQVDGVPTDDFERKGTVIKLNFEVPPTARIGIQYLYPEDLGLKSAPQGKGEKL